MGITTANPNVTGIPHDPNYYNNNTQYSHTGDTTKTTVLTVTLPVLGANDTVRITTEWTRNSAGTADVTVGIDLGGTAPILAEGMATTALSMHTQQRILNNNSQTAQKIHHWAQETVYTKTTAAMITSAINTTVPTNLTFYITCTNAADTGYLEAVHIEHILGTV